MSAEASAEAELEAAAGLAEGVRSFLSSLPYMAPEAIGFQAKVKLAEPLADYDEETSDA